MAMHSNWNPWHGCIKCSEGCKNCYVYHSDRLRGKNAAEVYKTKTGFKYPLSKDRKKQYKIQSGEMLSVCMTSDFFLEEADDWRDEAWDIMRKRCDVVFLLLTKRPERIRKCLPEDWGDGWENIFLNVTCETQRRADERLPLLLELPFKRKGLYCAPLLEAVTIGKYLDSGQIEQVACGGENYGGARPCDFDWVKALREECASRDITFCFMETGTTFIKDGREYKIESKRLHRNDLYQGRQGVQNRKQTPAEPAGISFGLKLSGQKAALCTQRQLRKSDSGERFIYTALGEKMRNMFLSNPLQRLL